MSYAICTLASVPLRAEPSHRSEMISQLLFGELCAILGQEGSWLHVMCDFDSYKGWIDIKQCRPVSDAFAEAYQSQRSPVCYDLVQVAFNESRKIAIPIVLGSTLPLLHDGRFKIDDDEYTYDGEGYEAPNATRGMICKTAMLYLNSPYLWGGRSPFGIDCSGYTQMVFMLNRMILPRDAHQQVLLGDEVAFVSEAQAGDLAFFQNDNGDVTHTGILLSNTEIIHASGRVRIDSIDHHGIFNKDLNRYTHTLIVIKRMSIDALPSCM